MKRYSFTVGLLSAMVLACNFVTDLATGGEEEPVAVTPGPTAPTARDVPDSPITVDGPTAYLGQEGCRDDGPGDAQTPYCSFETAVARLRPGDTLVIKSGTYTDRVVLVGLAGRGDAPIAIRGETRDSVIFDGGCPAFPCGLNDVDWPWDDEAGLVTIEDSHDIILSDMTVGNTVAAGVSVFGGNSIVVRNVVVDGTGNAGMLFKHTAGLLVTNNDIGRFQLGWRDDRDDPQPGAHEALSLAAVTNFEVSENYVHDGLKEGIDVKESSRNGKVHHNFVERTCGVGIYINEAHDVQVHHNQIRRSGYYLADGREELCASYPIYGRMLGEFYGGGILLAVGDLGELSQGRLSNVSVFQNVTWDLVGNGLEFWDEWRDGRRGQGEMTGNRVTNNVFYNTTLGGIRLSDVEGTIVANNILALNDEGAVTGNAIAENTISHNLFFFRHEGQEPSGTDFLVGDPLFVDPGSGDFHLQLGSPAIDSGLDVGLDYRGSGPDIGAYEHGPPALADVRHWLYLIDVNLEPETLQEIVESSHDMIVLDFIPSEENNTVYPMAETVTRLHEAPHPKLVLAYIDVGQAENFRTYWQPNWEIGDPEWIAGDDPDGWEGNFPVAFWHDDWREIWLGPEGYLQAILDAGFDGVYLDWVEAYSDENVLDIAAADGVDARQEMIWWVSDIAEFGRAQRPDFIVIAQNAAELAESNEYARVIDAIAQEQVWFDGGADNDPPGDCPLPRTEDEVDTEAYRESLSPACRRQYDEFPDSTLHVSSEEYLGYLTRAQAKGVTIFTVDYALDSENVAWVYETSRAMGFVPFVGGRALDAYEEPFP